MERSAGSDFILIGVTQEIAGEWLSGKLHALSELQPGVRLELHVVPFAPGGAVDTTNRLITGAANAADLLQGDEFVIENIANSVVGQATAARAEPDGSTVLAMTPSIVTAPKLSDTPYKLTDFRPVAIYGLDPEVIAFPAASDIQTVEDFIAKAKDGGASVVTSGVGTSHHMSGIALRNRADLQLNIHQRVGLWRTGSAGRGRPRRCGPVALWRSIQTV